MPNVIAGILPGGAADRDGRLKRGDRIVGIGDGSDGPITDTRKATTKEIKTLFEAGEREGDLRLQVVRDGETQIRTYSLKTDVSRDWLDAVLETADKERWRARLRRAYDVSDPIERRAVLDRLAEEADVEHQPVRVLTRLGMNLSSPERSAALLKRVCRRYPRDVLSNCFLAMSFQGMGEHQDAVRYYAVAIALRPNAGDHLGLGNALREIGKAEEAIEEFRECHRLEPDWPAPLVNITSMLCQQGKVDEAIAEYRKAIKARPDNAALHFNLGGLLAFNGRIEEPVVEFREAIRLKPNWDVPLEALADALNGQGKPEEAVAEYRKAIKARPDNAVFHHLFGEF